MGWGVCVGVKWGECVLSTEGNKGKEGVMTLGMRPNFLRRAHIVAADNQRLKGNERENCKIVAANRRQKRNKQDSLTGGNDLQRQHDGKGRMAAAGNGV